MKKEDLPEKLRNIPGLRMVTGEKVEVLLSETQMRTFEDLFRDLPAGTKYQKQVKDKET